VNREPLAPVVDILPPGTLANLGILTAVPVVEPLRWYDERQGCRQALLYVAGEIDGKPSDYAHCHFFCNGSCRMNGNPTRDDCLFHLNEDAEPWRQVRSNALLQMPDGSTAVCRKRDAARMAGELGAVVVGAVAVEVRG